MITFMFFLIGCLSEQEEADLFCTWNKLIGLVAGSCTTGLEFSVVSLDDDSCEQSLFIPEIVEQYTEQRSRTHST